MLPKKYRLTKNEDFSKIYAKGFYGTYDGVAIKYLETGSKNVLIGFSVGKNFSKKAVDRNRAKRILREACREYLAVLKPGFSIVIMPRSEKKSIELEEAKKSLEQIFKKAKLIIK